jgi:predicted peptidase
MMSKRLLMVIGIMCCVSIFTKAQLKAIYGKASYNFWISLPHDSILKSNPPVVIFLHGKSLSGTDLNRVRRYGIITEIERGRNVPAIVIAPQVNKGKHWEPDKVLELLNYIQATYKTDTNRVYVAGMSLGGYGTMHFAGKYPNRVAAAVALCGGGNEKDACRLATIPVWIQHGKLDKAVPISESDKMVRAIVNCNGGKLLKYTVHTTYDHGHMARVFRTDEFYDWLFSQAKNKVTLQFNPIP